ncbi:MAG: alpha/beta hydrolase [Betaproteobacteria bacterium]|nr:alpha/beta hydrolase [Betaproteobacteria bacterium]
MPFVTAAGHKLEYEWIDSGDAEKPVLVFLHEGLGSIRQWRDFPMQVVKATGCRALVYNRYGYGQSDVLEELRKASFMHDEARIALPELLRALGVAEPILIGHSDGASIALIHAGSGHSVRGLAIAAPHVFMEAMNVTAIEELTATFESGDLPERLGKYHRDSRKTFYGWSDVWRSDGFHTWNIEEFLPRIRCPLIVIQGAADQYGSMAQLEAIARQVSGPCEVVKLEQCGHSPHRDQPQATLEVVSRFVESILRKQTA